MASAAKHMAPRVLELRLGDSKAPGGDYTGSEATALDKEEMGKLFSDSICMPLVCFGTDPFLLVKEGPLHIQVGDKRSQAALCVVSGTLVDSKEDPLIQIRPLASWSSDPAIMELLKTMDPTVKVGDFGISMGDILAWLLVGTVEDSPEGLNSKYLAQPQLLVKLLSQVEKAELDFILALSREDLNQTPPPPVRGPPAPLTPRSRALRLLSQRGRRIPSPPARGGPGAAGAAPINAGAANPPGEPDTPPGGPKVRKAPLGQPLPCILRQP